MIWVRGFDLLIDLKWKSQNATGISSSSQSLNFFWESVAGRDPFETLWDSNKYYHYPKFKITRWCLRSKHTS